MRFPIYITVTALLCFIWVLVGMLSPTHCIYSNTVKKIDIFNSSQQQATVYSCQHQRAKSSVIVPKLSLANVNYKIQKVENLITYLGSSVMPLNVALYDGRANYYHVDGRNIWMGTDLFFSNGEFERALIKSWLLQRGGEKIKENALIQNVLTDFYYSFLYEDFGFLSDNKTVRWPNVLKSLSGYCNSNQAMPEHAEFCEDLRATSTREDVTMPATAHNFSPYSFRPFLSHSFIDSYQRLSFASQQKFLRNSLAIFSAIDWSVFDALLFPVADCFTVARSTMRVFFDRLSEQIEDETLRDEFAHHFYMSLWHSGFKLTLDRSNTFDLLVVVDGSLQDKQDILYSLAVLAQKNPGKTVAAVVDSFIWIFPETRPFAIDWQQIPRAQKGIHVACGIPDLKQIKNYGSVTSHLLTVEHCDNEEIDFNSYMALPTTINSPEAANSSTPPDNG